ncbi:P-loop containing nucleoside triphosphate hydrolase protein [Xylaria digitata]|nr:P-loop containing nucleoside triphosphate hydrolase protein [Xylaria digitata]
MDETIEPAAQYDGGQLQTKDHRDLLDAIDTLRSQGIDRYVDLPQIIVCGDQSSGKSSVLEAISGLSFPTKDNLCTRFATELILRRNPVAGTLDLSQVVEAAKQAMGLDGSHNVFSADILRVEISGPTQPHLTMTSRKMARHARALDPESVRTLGLITKPDTLGVGSDSERFFVELAQNKGVKFRLGWHVIRNRSYITRDASTVERDRAEAKLFSTRIVTQLPNVLKNVEVGIRECEDKLSKLGAARRTVAEQRRHLFRISTSFTSVIKASIDGNYTDAFFVNMDTTNQYPKRLRAVIQNTLLDFAEQMRTDGHARIILEQESSETSGHRYISRRQYIEVKSVMKESRGCELKGDLRAKLEEILHPHLSGHPITYNHYLTENVQKAQNARNRRAMEKRMVDFLGCNLSDDISRCFNPKSLLDSLVSATESDMDKYSCSMAIDMMEAYYKVALKTLIDDKSVLAIEKCLLQKLPELFSPDIICNLTDTEVHLTTAESETSAAERENLSEKLSVLQGGLIRLGNFKKPLTSVTLAKVS